MMSSIEQIEPAQAGDWDVFLAWTGQEGWRVPPQELALLRGAWSRHAWVLRSDGACGGFVSAVPHQRSGWIGNLIVPAAGRGQGRGARLFEHALDQLAEQGIGSVWLTASEQGRPLYQRRGFVDRDGIERWVRPAGIGGVAPRPDASAWQGLLAADRRCWGESRGALLEAFCRGGTVVQCGDTVALLQWRDALPMIGPWYSFSVCPRENRQVLTALLQVAPVDTELVVDLRSSAPVRPLLAAAGFVCAGQTRLMVRGPEPPDGLQSLMALASLGSVG